MNKIHELNNIPTFFFSISIWHFTPSEISNVDRVIPSPISVPSDDPEEEEDEEAIIEKRKRQREAILAKHQAANGGQKMMEEMEESRKRRNIPTSNGALPISPGMSVDSSQLSTGDDSDASHSRPATPGAVDVEDEVLSADELTENADELTENAASVSPGAPVDEEDGRVSHLSYSDY